MKVVRKLILENYPDFQAGPLGKIFTILNEDGLNARLVGGCVRDILLGRKIFDFDFACALPPEETMKRLKKKGIKVIPTGLKHGTITAVIGKDNFEITCLRCDVETYGRRAKVAFVDDWQIDAERRDFTFNALYMDQDGSLYDPCHGLTDLAQRRVRFIGDAHRRITEDALRILRFFRFAAQIGQGILDSVGLECCIEHLALIDNLSGERLAQEMFKILTADNVIAIIPVMEESGLLSKIVHGHPKLDLFKGFVALENSLGRCDMLGRLSCLIPKNKQAVLSVSRHLKLSNRQTKILSRYIQCAPIILPNLNKKDIRKFIYSSGRDVFIFALFQGWAGNFSPQSKAVYAAMLYYGEHWIVPKMPILGKDLLEQGFSSGPKLGRLLKALEGLWIESDFCLLSEDLLSLASNGELTSDV